MDGLRLPRYTGSKRVLPALVVAGFLLVLAAASGAHAQQIAFGKNKVNYHDFRWSVLRSPHFRLYYYPEEESLARMALGFAERSYEHHVAFFTHDVADTIPLILFSSHHDFEQTNITPMLIPEGVGGLTESMRGRVLMPFDGSLYRFRTTLQHELVHAFQMSLVSSVVRRKGCREMVTPPLWFTEGLAEHWSAKWDADADMVMRDLVVSGRLPSIAEFWRFEGTFTMYKLGQSVLDFLAMEYGEDKIRNIYMALCDARDFSGVWKKATGVSLERFSSRWMQWLRRKYYPDVTKADPVLEHARAVPGTGMDLKPTPIPGDSSDRRYVFISPASGYVNIYVGNLYGAERKTIVEGQRSPEFLSFHGFRSRMDVSRDGILAFSSKAGPRDALFAYDLHKGSIVGRWEFEDLVGITSPSWSPDGRTIVFSGLARNGTCDLYLLDVFECKLERLTEDFYSDKEPAFHPDGERIVFVSDRGQYGSEGALNLFVFDLATGEIRCLTSGPWWDLSPSWSPDGRWLLFSSTRDGMRDLYAMDARGRGYRLTRVLEALLDPRWACEGDSIVATCYKDGRFLTVLIPAGLDKQRPIAFLSGCSDGWEPWVLSDQADSLILAQEEYKPSFGVEVAQGGVAVDPSLGNGEGLQLLLRDMMGNKMVLIQVANTSFSGSDILDNFSAGVTYINLSSRLNKGVSVYHHAGTYLDEYDLPFFERRAGVTGILSYPFSRFTRLETSFGIVYSEKDKPSTGLRREGLLATHYVSWIRDTSLWLSTGPIDGGRSHLTLGMTMNLERPGVENFLFLGDARRYVRLGRQSALALRLQARFSEGPDPQVFLLGGSHTLRGYGMRELHGTRSVLANAEVRFPFIRGLLVDPSLLGPLSFPQVQGAVFFDAGQAWYGEFPGEVRGSYGVGFRMGLGGFLVLRLDLARLTDFKEWPRKVHTDFFIGWNY